MESKRPPKRLRGWKLQAAQEDPCQKGFSDQEEVEGNPLATRLVELWSIGKLSATQATEICHLSMLSGCDHPEILAIAKCGSFGENKSNSHRDLVALYCKKMYLAQPHLVKVPMKDTKTQRECKEEVALLLPHMMFANLSTHYPDIFEDLFCLSECLGFWKNVAATKDPRLTLTKGKVASPGKTVPIFVHGDGCEFATRDSLMTWSWGSLLSKNPSLSSHLLLTAVPKSCSLPTTWRPLDDWISWSFAALTKGMHPDVDPYGRPLTKGLMAELAGQPLTKGLHRGVIWSIQGDAEFLANVLKLPHWQNKFPCHECNCQKPIYKKEPCPPGKSVKIIKEEDQEFQDTTIDQAVLDKRTNHPLFNVPGVSTLHVRGDSLHILYCKGVGSHLAGSLVHYLCFYDYPRRQTVAPSARLATLFAQVKELYSQLNTPVRLTNLKLSMICDPAKPHKFFPVLDAKASETKHLMPILQILLQELLEEDEEIHASMILCIEAFNDIVKHYDSVGAFLTATEFAYGMSLVKRFFDSYQDLNSWALTKGRKLFHITHKFHSAKHLFKNTKYLNFRAHHNFRAEDFVGQISQLGHSCSFGVRSTRLPIKLVAKYLILLHLQLTKPGFSSALQPDDP